MTVAGAVANGSQVRGMCGRESLANSRNYTYSVTYTKNKNLFTHHPSNEALRNACAACRWIDGNSQSQQRIPEPLFGIIQGEIGDAERELPTPTRRLTEAARIDSTEGAING